MPRATAKMKAWSTRSLRAAIERRQAAYLWGQKSFITPRLCGKVFGDGKKLIALWPIMFRPNHFVVRIDSSWSTSNWDHSAEVGPSDWLDDVYGALEEEYLEWPWAKAYGLRWSDDERDDRNSRINFSDGCSWDEIEWPRELPAAARKRRRSSKR